MRWFKKCHIQDVPVTLAVERRARELYVAQNFQGEFAPERLPHGFPEHMWNTTSPDVRKKWIRRAQEGTP